MVFTDAETAPPPTAIADEDFDLEERVDIFINNACGQLFFFKNVWIMGGGIDDWFDANDIEDVVENNLGSCDWGCQKAPQKTIDEPEGGWLKGEEE